MQDPVIQVNGVYKSFKLPHQKLSSVKSLFISIFKGRQTYEIQNALKNISFEVNKGDFLAIVGRNGSGKSTLLKLLAGIYTPNKGAIRVNGKLVPFIELGVGFNPELTGRENVFLNGALLGFNRREMEAMYEEIVGFAELRRFMDQKLKNYSSGMQVRLAFSIAIRAKGDILLLDEVLAVGDAAFQQKCFNYFEELRELKKTVVFVSHDMGAVKRFCNRAIYIKNGKLIHDGTTGEVADMYVLDNLENMQKNQNEDADSNDAHVVKAKITKQSVNTVALEMAYRSSDEEKMYLALSIIRDGVSIAEITTPAEMELVGQGKVQYNIDTEFLNGGVYEVAVAMSRWRNRELVAVAKDRPRFVIKGSDVMRGGALRLKDSWENQTNP